MTVDERIQALVQSQEALARNLEKLAAEHGNEITFLLESQKSLGVNVERLYESVSRHEHEISTIATSVAGLGNSLNATNNDRSVGGSRIQTGRQNRPPGRRTARSWRTDQPRNWCRKSCTFV